MNTPIFDFIRQYADSNTLRFHVPGHKGAEILGCERLDITEMSGADSLYEAEGIIRQSEDNASFLFGSHTFYSTEGSSHCIRAMVYLASLKAKEEGRKSVIAAGRNAHKSFLSAVALTDAEVRWIYPRRGDSYLSCNITAEEIEALGGDVTAVYITSPDYLGNRVDIEAISEKCKEKNILLMVDNAHGAYLRFLPLSEHPIDLGADMCCDSAHKSLSVLTGGAYLHIKDDSLALMGKRALSIFGSTSPSYLIMASLDKANETLAGDYKDRLLHTVSKIEEVKKTITDKGYTLGGNEALKITVQTKKYGYTGNDFADILRENGIEVEFSDPDYVVMMFTTETTDNDLEHLSNVLKNIEKLDELTLTPPPIPRGEMKLSVREAIFSPCESIAVEESLGRILADAGVGCPPAVCVAVCGEEITKEAIACFRYYGIEKINVVR